MPMLSDEYRYKILKRLEADPKISQRTLANELGISVGKANFCLQALIEKGLVKANNFKNSSNKKAYMYLLTPRGIEEKAKITAQFLSRKIAEYEALEKEIQQLRQYVQKSPPQVDAPLEESAKNT
jgi:EPS-associated MarR family transcriptional regulator